MAESAFGDFALRVAFDDPFIQFAQVGESLNGLAISTSERKVT